MLTADEAAGEGGQQTAAQRCHRERLPGDERRHGEVAASESLRSYLGGAGVAEGTRTLPVRVAIATAGRVTTTKPIWIDSRDLGLVSPVMAEPGVFRRTLDGLSDVKPRPDSTGAWYEVGSVKRRQTTLHSRTGQYDFRIHAPSRRSSVEIREPWHLLAQEARTMSDGKAGGFP